MSSEKQCYIKSDAMMAGAHCAQCSDTRNIYIKTCDCSKREVNKQLTIHSKPNSVKKEFNSKASAVDQKGQQTDDQPKLKAVKAVVYRVVRVYETVPSKTMKFIGAFTLLLLLVAVFSVALAQNKEETKSQYGMAFPLEESSPLNSEQRVSLMGSVPGEGVQSTPPAAADTTSESPVTTTSTPTTDESPAMTTEDSDKKSVMDDMEGQNGDNQGIIIAGADDEDDKSGSDGEEKANPRLVFIERLMGLHLTAPLNGQKEEERDDNSAADAEPPMPFSMDGNRNPFDKVNAKWATRMRKFSIPLMQQQPSPPETPNPLLRVAAAAMMTRLLAAAARAHHNGPMMAKDKDDDAEDETVPILLASMRSDEAREPPMYGRPMPRPPMMRPPMRPPIKIVGQPQQRMASIAIPQRLYSAQMMAPQRSSPMVQQRAAALPPYQPVLVMLAHVPVPMQMAESRMGGGPDHVSQYYAPQQHSMPMYPQVPYALPLGYHPMQRQVVEVPTPVHMPIPVASYHRPVYQSPYQSSYQSNYQSGAGPTVQYQRQSSRPVIEIPIEIPIPVHVPVPVSYQGGQQQSPTGADHDASASEAAEQVAIVYYDPDNSAGGDEGQEGVDHYEPHTSESHENAYAMPPKGFQFMSRPLPDIQSATKLKLWREYVGAKHAAQPGVRYIPVSVNGGGADEGQHTGANMDGSDSQQQSGDQSEGTAESHSQPAFVILADDGQDGSDGQQHH